MSAIQTNEIAQAYLGITQLQLERYVKKTKKILHHYSTIEYLTRARTHTAALSEVHFHCSHSLTYVAKTGTLLCPTKACRRA